MTESCFTAANPDIHTTPQRDIKTMAFTQKQTASADESARGFILIKEGGELLTTVWVNDIMSVNRDDKEKGGARITIRAANGLWFRTTASVGEVFAAISTARVLMAARKRSA